MYHVNTGVPKTLVRYLIDWTAESEFKGPIAAILRDVAQTPISPELLPLNRKGQLQQKTEETVGPYELHDFYLYYFVRHQFSAEKILYLAEQAFAKRYPRTILQKWLQIFLTRFVQQQFKRSSMPDGPKVGSVALSPRADWRMPSDAEFDP
jgi:NAD+ synthase (glutamine-hydrolysing)